MEQESQLQLDVYFQGSQNQLFAFLYPLSGTFSNIFQSFKLEKSQYDPNLQKFTTVYTPQCKNIDKQLQNIYYKGTALSSQSNYFYSTYQPLSNSLIWRNVTNFVEMRPQTANKASQSDLNQNANNITLEIVESQKIDNLPQQQILNFKKAKLQQNWEVSKQQYLKYLSK